MKLDPSRGKNWRTQNSSAGWTSIRRFGLEKSCRKNRTATRWPRSTASHGATPKRLTDTNWHNRAGSCGFGPSGKQVKTRGEEHEHRDQDDATKMPLNEL